MHNLHISFYIIIAFLIIKPLQVKSIDIEKQCKEIEILLDSANHIYNVDKFKKAESLIEETRDIFNKIKYPAIKSDKLDSLYLELNLSDAWIKTLCEKYSEAEPIFLKTIDIIPKNEYRQLSNSYMKLSSLYGMQKIYAKSETYAYKALEYANMLNDNELMFHARSNLGDIYLYTKQYEKALIEYHEVRKLSIILGRYEAISIGNLAIINHRLNKLNIAEQYYKEAMAISEKDNSFVYSIILPEYCNLLIEKGEKIKARKLVSKAIQDNKNLQNSNNNLALLKILAQTEDAYKPVFTIISILASIMATGIIILIVTNYNKLKRNDKLEKENLILEEENNRLKKDISDSPETKTANSNIPLNLMAIEECLTQVTSLTQQIKYSVGSKSEIYHKAVEIEKIISPFNDENTKNKMSMFYEQENSLGKILKSRHPDINLSDIKLCIQIRCGLSTKEIASLTNKSVRGVESAKFRLRKKLELPTQKDIYDYILEIENQSATQNS